MATLSFDHPLLGPVTIVERRGSQKLSARWTSGQLRVNVPAGLTRSQISAAIDRHISDFEAIRPAPRYHDGLVIDIPGANATETDPTFAIAIMTDPRIDSKPLVTTSTEGNHLRFNLLVSPKTDFRDPAVQERLDHTVKLAGRNLAPRIIIPRARLIASRLGLRVDKWETAHGTSVLGTCYPRQRRIRLSYLNVFLTPELRDYIIYHELAHLTEPGHTPAFHALCDRYCGGRERELIRKLHSYPWPVNR